MPEGNDKYTSQDASARPDVSWAFPSSFPPPVPVPPQEHTLADYLRQNHASFEKVPFNGVDSLVLSTLVYLNFEEVDFADVGGTTPVPIIDILRFCDYKRLTSASWLKNGDDVLPFFEAFARNRRFGNLGVCLYVRDDSENIDKQFAACTFVQAGMEPYVCFRGTDGSVKGWKEDFDLAYKDIIPSQRDALRYLSGVLSSFPGANVRVGGHSKGGNQAEYAAALLHESQFPQILAIYNHDGPNFLNDPSPRYASDAYREKHFKFVPESSIFGMILENADDLRIVQSNSVSFFQHRPVSWLVNGNDFAYSEALNSPTQFFDKALDSWLHSCTPEQRSVFFNTIFDVIGETQVKSWREFQNNLPSNLAKVLRTTRNMDDETKEAVMETMGHLRIVLKDMTTERVQQLVRRIFTE